MRKPVLFFTTGSRCAWRLRSCVIVGKGRISCLRLRANEGSDVERWSGIVFFAICCASSRRFRLEGLRESISGRLAAMDSNMDVGRG